MIPIKIKKVQESYTLAVPCSTAAFRFLHNVVLDKEGGAVEGTFISSFCCPINGSTTTSSKGGEETGKNSKRRRTLAWPVVSMGSSKMTGLIGEIA
jgi:hypothetical protein